MASKNYKAEQERIKNQVKEIATGLKDTDDSALEDSIKYFDGGDLLIIVASTGTEAPKSSAQRDASGDKFRKPDGAPKAKDGKAGQGGGESGEGPSG